MNKTCIFCDYNEKERVAENDLAFAIYDNFPVNEGHTLIIPKKHFKDAFDIDEKYLEEIMKASKIVMNIINEKLKPTGIKCVQNNGVLQEIKHYHMHIVPHYNKNTKINLEEIYNELIK